MQRNRPGANANAVKGAVRSFNVPNGSKSDGKNSRPSKGKPASSKMERCIRFGATDHTWHTCPLPYQPQLAFVKSNGVPSKFKNAQKVPTPDKKILLSEEIMPTVEENQVNEEPNGQAEQAAIEVNPEYGCGEAEAWGENDYYDPFNTYLTWVCHTYPALAEETPMKNSMSAAIDSGASSSVASLKWAKEWMNSEDIPLTASSKRIAFGPHTAVPSLGSMIANAAIMVLTVIGTYAERIIRVQIDIVRGPTPCLLSRECLSRMGGIIDFQEGKLLIPDMGEIKLEVSEANHFRLPWKPAAKRADPIDRRAIGGKNNGSTLAFPTETMPPAVEEQSRALSLKGLRKLHLHLGHANKLAMVRTMRAAEIPVEMKDIQTVLGACPCEVSKHDQIQPPAVGPYRVFWAGHTVMADLRYPVTEDARTFPYI